MNKPFKTFIFLVAASAAGWLAVEATKNNAEAAFDELDGKPAEPKKPAAPAAAPEKAAPAPKKPAAPTEKAAPKAATSAPAPARPTAPKVAKEPAPTSGEKGTSSRQAVAACHQRVTEFLNSLRMRNVKAALAQTSESFKQSIPEAELSKFQEYITERGGGRYAAVEGGPLKDGTILTVGSIPLDGDASLIITAVHKDGKIISLRGSL